MYGFVMRSCTDFTRPSTLLYLFKSLVRSQLEYATPVWNPYYNKYTDSLELVQRKFLRRVDYNFTRNRKPYVNLLKRYKLMSLKNRRLQLQTFFLYDICHSKYDSVLLNNLLCFNVPRNCNVRNNHKLFFAKFCRTNAGKRSPMYRITQSYNAYFNNIDIMSVKPREFERGLLTALEKIPP